MAEGKGEISFAKDPTVPDYCGENPEDWCFVDKFTETSDFYGIGAPEGFGRAPGHPAMYNPEYMSEDEVVAIQEALEQMSNDEKGEQIILDVMSSPGLTITNTTNHLGTYGDAISGVPGIQAYFGEAFTCNESRCGTPGSSNTMLIAGATGIIVLVGGAVYLRRIGTI